MKKRMMTFLMVCLFVLGSLPVYAAEASLDFLVSADKKTASVGDTVHYTIVAKGENVIALQFDVAVPDGMSYVPDSAATPKGLSADLGVAAAGWTEQTMRFSFYNDKAVQIPEGTVLLTFDCTVTAEGNHQVSLSAVAPYDSDFTGFQPAIQANTVVVGEVSEEGETEIQPVPPETGIEEPYPGTDTPPDDVTVPGVTEEPETPSGSVDGSDTVDSSTPSDGVGDSVGVNPDAPSGSVSDSDTGSAGDPSGGIGGSSDGATDVDPDSGSADAPSGNVSGSVEGSTGSTGDHGSTDLPSGNSGASVEGSAGNPSGGGDVSSPDGSTSSSDSGASSGNGSTTLPNDETLSQPQDPDTPVSNPEVTIPEQGTTSTDETPVQQPGQDTIISAEDTLTQRPESDTTGPKQEEETVSDEENASDLTTGETESASDPETSENHAETLPPIQQDAEDQNEEKQFMWLWITLAVVGVLAIAAVVFLIAKKKDKEG